MKTIIAGSRSIEDIELIDSAVLLSRFVVSAVLCGMAAGVDTAGRLWADQRGIPVMPYPANWKPGGVFDPTAGFKRNQDMADDADALIAVWDGHSRGTLDMIKRAKKKGLRSYVMDLSKPQTTQSVLNF